MSQPTFEERCLLVEQCLPDAPYRDMLKKLHAEMLAALANHIPDAGKMVEPEPVAQRELIKKLADQYAKECVEFAKAIPSGAHSMSPIAVKSGDTRLSFHTAIDAMTAAPQPAQQEPVLFVHPSTLEMASSHVGAWKPGHELPGYIALYAAPPQRQPLTDEECVEAIDASFEFALANGNVSNTSVIRYARAIEAKLKEQP